MLQCRLLSSNPMIIPLRKLKWSTHWHRLQWYSLLTSQLKLSPLKRKKSMISLDFQNKRFSQLWIAALRKPRSKKNRQVSRKIVLRVQRMDQMNKVRRVLKPYIPASSNISQSKSWRRLSKTNLIIRSREYKKSKYKQYQCVKLKRRVQITIQCKLNPHLH